MSFYEELKKFIGDDYYKKVLVLVHEEANDQIYIRLTCETFEEGLFDTFHFLMDPTTQYSVDYGLAEFIPLSPIKD